jgi:hypothetical protein
VYSCSTYEPQQSSNAAQAIYPSDKKIVHTFYLFGDGGTGVRMDSVNPSNSIQNNLNTASKNSSLLFLGDNIYPVGMPKKEDSKRKDAEKSLQNQIDITASFKGKTIFIPGNHDWYSDGVEGLKREQEFIEKQLGKKSFLPKNGCAIETVTISDDIVLIIVDSQWYITNWNKEPIINDECDIKTRTQFLEEFRSEVKKARGKTTLIAVHHPMFSNGSHGGQYSFKSHLKPFPIIGSLKNLLRKTTGIANTDMQNKYYKRQSNFRFWTRTQFAIYC